MKLLLALLFLSVSETTFAQGASSGSKHGAATWGGRFQLIQLSEFRRDQFLLDTDTGRMWGIACTKDGKNGQCEMQSLIELEVENLHKAKTH